jgi:hypothetical protein
LYTEVEQMLIRDLRAVKAPLIVSLGLLVIACGGKVETEPTPSSESSDGGAAMVAAGGASSTDICPDSGIDDDAGCAGESGLDPSTGLRSACGGSTTVARTGTPVPICFHIR